MRKIIILLLALTQSCVSPIPHPEEGREDLIEGRRLYIAKCSGCHNLYIPSEYDDTGWQEWVEKMVDPAKITPGEAGSIGRYLLAVND